MSGRSNAGAAQLAAHAAALRLSDKEFTRLRSLIEVNLGIQITDAKRSMLETRIGRRMRELSLGTISEYCARLEDPVNARLEQRHFFDLVTTNKTSFFREPTQLDLIATRYFGDLLRGAARQSRPLRVWSAACSTGQEVWTLCMMLDGVRRAQRIQAEFLVMGSDVSSRVLKTAVAAKYPSAELSEIPPAYHQYLMKSRDPKRALMRVSPELRKQAGFFHLNLMNEAYDVGDQVDVVLLRNALIYFPRERQHLIVERVHRKLRAGGLFAVGLTETLHGAPIAVSHVGSSIYVKSGAR
ncbi:MAG: CheR family methyltransferase [Polyangiaceae bacterium]